MFKIGDKVRVVGNPANEYGEEWQSLFGKVGTIVDESVLWDWRVKYDESNALAGCFMCLNEDELELVESC